VIIWPATHDCSVVPVINQEEAFWYVKDLHEQEKGVDQGHETGPS
jgi:hypothetical protein